MPRVHSGGPRAHGSVTILCPVDGTLQTAHVFSEDKAVAPCLAIAATGRAVCAPVAGIIESVHEDNHSVTLISDEGPRLVVSLGPELSLRNGEGITAEVSPGDRVAAGERILSLDTAYFTHSGVQPLVSVFLGKAGWKDELDKDSLAELGHKVVAGNPLVRFNQIQS